MHETAPSGKTSKPLIAPVFAIAAASCLAGVALALNYKDIAFAVLTQLLQPGGTAYMVPDHPLTVVYFPIKLFFVGGLFIAAPLATAWLTSVTYKQYARMATLLLVSSVALSSAACFSYRQYMQVEVTDLRINGKLVPSRSKGQITPLGEVPIGMLALSGPLLASTVFLLRRRRAGQSNSYGVPDQ